jgi:hypothetical protein
MILRRPLVSGILASIVLSGCQDKPGSQVVADSTAAPSDPPIIVDSMATPESAIHDSIQDVYLVSNINGSPTELDNNGFISRVRPDGTVDAIRFIAGGVNGVTLNGPKGLAIRGDSLWVADITVVRIFNARTGASLGTVDLGPSGAIFLNDVAAGPDGSIYITDSGFKIVNGDFTHPGPDRIYRIAPDRAVTVLMMGDQLGVANGITWDPSANRLLLGPLSDSTISSFALGDSGLTAVVKGPGGYDGIEALGGGSFVVSSLDASSILIYRNGVLRTVIDSLEDPADIGLDRKRGRVLIPSLGGNRLTIRTLPQ